ncbi:MAG: TIM44-like domain-containing protein [Peptococcaceae bacterium]|nr:TIM44-like domain-containing protein [Peptococcaceae bacterium]
MKTWTKTLGILLTTLTLWIAQTSIALARAGGGRGGSIGGSSGSAGRSFSGGGSFSGGSSGGTFFGGFPFFFWGGGGWGYGSSFGGIITLIFIIVIIYIVYKALKSKNMIKGYRSKDNKPRMEDLPPDTPVDLNGEIISNDSNDQRFTKAISYTRENMRYFAETFPRWDRDYLIGRVRQVFFWFQDAWTRMDLSEAGEYITPDLLKHYQSDLAGMKSRGERNMIKDPVLHADDITFIHSHLSEDNEHFVVMIWANLIDYTIDSQGRVVSGDDTNRLYFTEFWEFKWENENWLLSKIHQEDALEIAKIARGDEQ